MNLLTLVPALQRQLRVYINTKTDTASTLAGYLADAVQALDYRWTRTYVVSLIEPATYSVTPDITDGDIRPVILMASIIYKMGNWNPARITDGDFSYDPSPTGVKVDPIEKDITELKARLPLVRLAAGVTAPMRGFNNIYNRENYDWSLLLDLIVV
jgi:hypothetical protein